MVLKSVFTAIKLFVIALVAILYIHYFIPQSWGFYTIEPRQPLYNIYIIRNGIADKTALIKNNISYGMGISLKGKMLYTELYSIIGNKGLVWKPLIDDSLDYITQHGNYTLISSAIGLTAFKGKFLVTKTNRPSYLMLKKGEWFNSLRQYVLADIR